MLKFNARSCRHHLSRMRMQDEGSQHACATGAQGIRRLHRQPRVRSVQSGNACLQLQTLVTGTLRVQCPEKGSCMGAVANF